MGRNVQYYCERFGGRLHDVINSSKKRTVLADDMIIRAGMIQELVIVRDGLLCLSGDYFSPANIDCSAVCRLIFPDFIFFYLFPFILFFYECACILRVRSS